MIPELTKFEQKTTLIMATGVQFLDFGLKLDLRKELPGDFVVQEGNRSLARLKFDDRLAGCVHPAKPGVLVQPKLTVPVDQSFDLFDKLWLPAPFFRMAPPRRFADGPTNWVRARIVRLGPGESPEDSTHRLTLALDTKILQEQARTAYLAPTANDVQAGAAFNLAYRCDEMAWFPETLWVAGWLQEVFEEKAREVLRLPEQDIEDEVSELMHHAHYLNWLALIGEYARIPEIKILPNTRTDIESPIKVDMVLDVGNSRTCGILIENHPQDESGGMKKRYELEMRDISMPHLVYSEPFESRLEFAEATFGKAHFSVQSGRNDAFLWPTIARVGKEATRLASRRRGTEGSTGLSSPKRYLWDDDPYEPGWRFNSAFGRNEIEPHATAIPFSNLIDELGEALYDLDPDEQMPVFFPRYSRSSLMMFMLSEVLVQALSQINSPSQRLRQSHANKPRHLRNIILTIPPSMPKPEREIFEKRMNEAVRLVWKSLGWHPENDKPAENTEDEKAWPPFPEIHVQWDEATCGQVVYLYTEIINNFSGRPEEFFSTARRMRGNETAKKFTVASIDVGGGTTDLVITDYALDSGRGSNVYIVP
ncbi:MAG: virulence factor SrfB, partial [Methylococcaceae bacterium]|nr:virulence factor SrfB [Methylococcaceae bacterium]